MCVYTITFWNKWEKNNKPILRLTDICDFFGGHVMQETGDCRVIRVIQGGRARVAVESLVVRHRLPTGGTYQHHKVSEYKYVVCYVLRWNNY